jgi:putative membrane protein insertion efficiency factor
MNPMAPLGVLMRGLVHAYRWLLAPVLPPACRHHPSCSEYALEALARFGPAGGAWLAAKRLARCHPWDGAGYDPVPDVPGAAPRRGTG